MHKPRMTLQPRHASGPWQPLLVFNARGGLALQYLKNCHAVWVVASITRAVDDKTAKEVLNSNLRRQLFMDGHYGNLAFVCTKTDSFNISDIVR